MAWRISRGCETCRFRKVKCDEGKPLCNNCLKRNIPCEGYRDVSEVIFQDESKKTAHKAQIRWQRFEQDLIAPSRHQRGDLRSETFGKSSDNVISCWKEDIGIYTSEEGEAISSFFDGLLKSPSDNHSSSGYLEYLPCLFEEVKVERRAALRWAVRAVAYGNLANKRAEFDLAVKAQRCYGVALSELRRSLSEPEASTSDYTLMTIVVLDLFELFCIGDSISAGSHVDGMAQILRLRGHKRVYDTREWSLFRLAHHRMQQKQLAYKQNPAAESSRWIELLDETTTKDHIEKDVAKVNEICQRAREVQAKISATDEYSEEALDLIKEMHALDYVASTWRAGQGWAYRKVRVSDLEIDQQLYPGFIQLHHDAWIAYEWNYHRTARVILHEHLLQCIDRVMESSSSLDQAEVVGHLDPLRQVSIGIIQTIIDEILSTVPQSFGDVDSEGRATNPSNTSVPCRSVASYFLLWPIKILKSTRSATSQQKKVGMMVFERIRRCTGMQEALGNDSVI